MGIYLTPVRMATVRKNRTVTTNAGGEVGKKEPDALTVGISVGCGYTEAITPQRCRHICVHNFTIPNS